MGDIYDRFETLCEHKGVKPYTVSKATGISTATLTNWKKGKYVPKEEKLKKIADYFGVTMEYLRTGESNEHYINEETAKVAQEIFENKGLRLLFDAARDAKPEDLETTRAMLLALKRKEMGE